MMRRLWQSRPMVLYGVTGEVRAGRWDARRTLHARPWQGFRYGDAFYSLGYAIGALVPSTVPT